jgi:hypothetical protein
VAYDNFRLDSGQLSCRNWWQDIFPGVDWDGGGGSRFSAAPATYAPVPISRGVLAALLLVVKARVLTEIAAFAHAAHDRVRRCDRRRERRKCAHVRSSGVTLE